MTLACSTQRSKFVNRKSSTSKMKPSPSLGRKSARTLIKLTSKSLFVPEFSTTRQKTVLSTCLVASKMILLAQMLLQFSQKPNLPPTKCLALAATNQKNMITIQWPSLKNTSTTISLGNTGCNSQKRRAGFSATLYILPQTCWLKSTASNRCTQCARLKKFTSGWPKHSISTHSTWVTASGCTTCLTTKRSRSWLFLKMSTLNFKKTTSSMRETLPHFTY